MSVILPKVTKAKLYGYNPIFENTIEIEIKNGLLILLGGNGLGKTTLLQSLIYGLAGPLDSKLEIVPEKRWNKNYFTQRLTSPDTAFIEIEFKLNQDIIQIKRGFQSEKLLEFFLNKKDQATDIDPESAFENYLTNYCNYDSLISFRFLIHKLCYLSEHRENLVWDRDIQTRILMLIFSDSIVENSFRGKNDQLQKLDSKIRHLKVDINKLTERLNSDTTKKQKPNSQTKKITVDKTGDDISELKQEYLQLINKRFDLQKNIRITTYKLSNLNSEIEDIQDKITQNEQQFLYKQITNFESEEAKLAIHKIIHYKLCPACGSFNQELYAKAIQFLRNEACPICGTENEDGIKKMSPGLEAELSEKIESKISYESQILAFESELTEISTAENNIQFNINKYMLDTPTVVFVKNYNVTKTNKEELQQALKNLNRQKTDFQIQFDKLKSELESEYETFRIKNNERINQLGQSYEKYSTEFLGMQCSLISIDNTRDFVELKLFVPSFNNIVRNSPESCSEAQRFFLDIAFRMSLIEMVCSLTQTNATFLCETPESALDISYRNNVSDMFQMFLKKKNTIILSSNIQPEGIAGSMLYHIPKDKRQSAIVNFLKIGKLSSVQQNQIEDLNSIVNGFLNQK